MTASTPRAAAARSRGLIVLALVVVLGLGGYGLWWWLHARNYESTDDAYVAADIVQITSEVAGTVVSVGVDDTQAVARGQALVELDTADADIALQAAEAELARAVRNVRAVLAQGEQLRAQISERRALLARAEADLARRRSLEADGAISGEEMGHARDAVTQARASLLAAQEQVRQVEAQTEGTTVETHPQVLAAAAAVRAASQALARTQLRAPVDGVVAKRAVQVGQRVAPGAPLMAVVPLSEVWVDANFKEVQLARLRIGQPVRLHADAYGDEVEFHGTVAGLSAGSGTSFALLPAQNASGNWIKIVQRVPVRIALDRAEVQAHPLRVGLSITATVDVQDGSGSSMAALAPPAAARSSGSAANDPAVSARIARIVAANAGRSAAQP